MAKPKPFNRLSWAVFNGYGSRKEQGLVSVVVDTETKLIYPVPLGEEHLEFVPKIIFLEKNDVFENPPRFSRFVPSLIETEFNPLTQSFQVLGVVTGISGLELGARVRHKKEQLELAHALVLDFVNRGELQVSEKFQHKLSLKYAA